MAKRKPLADHVVRYRFTAAYLKRLEENDLVHDMVAPITITPGTARSAKGEYHIGMDYSMRGCVFITDAHGYQTWIHMSYLQPINGYLNYASGR